MTGDNSQALQAEYIPGRGFLAKGTVGFDDTT